MIDIRNQTFVGVNKLVAREDPWHIPSIQRYTPAERKTSKESLKQSLRRVRTRHTKINIDNPVYYEVHLSSTTKATATENIEDPKIGIGTFFTVHGIKENELSCRNNCTCLIYGPEGQEQLYYVLTWDDAVHDPMKEKTYTGNEQTRRKLNRCRFPRGQFRRVEKGRRVHYLRLATPQEFRLVMSAIGRIKDVCQPIVEKA